MMQDNKKTNKIIFLMCVFFCLMGVMLTRNEISADHWYIEATADGYFGSNNRFLLTICSNFIVEGLIYLLSLTRIRLFWLYFIMIGLNFVGTYFVCAYICSEVKSLWKYALCVLYNLCIIPIIFFDINFTIVAIYALDTGCVYMFYCIENKKKWTHYLLATCVLILGAGLRFDCVVFAVIYMGMVCLFKLWIEIKEEKKPSNALKKYIVPFCVALAILIGIQVTQKILENKYIPGFSTWNSARSNIDDYDMPAYNDAEDQYKALGVSENDYKLMRAHNNIDNSFYNQEMYENLTEVKDLSRENYSIEDWKKLMSKGVLSLTGTYVFVLFIVGCFEALVFLDKKIFAFNILVGMVSCALAVYFVFRGRWISRTELPVLISAGLACVCVLKGVETKKKQNIKHAVKNIFGVLVLLVIVLTPSTNLDAASWNPISGGNIVSLYKKQIKTENIFARYLFKKLKHEEIDASCTFDQTLYAYCSSNDDKLFYHLTTYNWLQPNPLPCKDILRMPEIGSGQNYASLGYYQCELPPILNNEENYGVKNRFQDLANNNIRITCDINEAQGRIHELRTYLEEHYYGIVTFSLEDEINGNIVGRFIADRDYVTSGKQIKKIEANIAFCKETEIEGLSRVVIEDVDKNMRKNKYENYYIEFIDQENGENFVYSAMNESEGDPIAYIDNCHLIGGKTYSVYLIKFENDEVLIRKLSEDFDVP